MIEHAEACPGSHSHRRLGRDLVVEMLDRQQEELKGKSYVSDDGRLHAFGIRLTLLAVVGVKDTLALAMTLTVCTELRNVQESSRDSWHVKRGRGGITCEVNQCSGTTSLPSVHCAPGCLVEDVVVRSTHVQAWTGGEPDTKTLICNM